MALFTVNPTRTMPYTGFNFRLKVDNIYVAGVSKISALKKTTEMVEFRSGGDRSTSHKGQGRTKYEAITLTAGVTHDPTFENWANAVNNFQGNAAGSNKGSRKDIIIDVFNENDQKVLSYKVFRCWVSEYQALPDLDAGANAVMIQTIKLENEGWERDTSVVEPTEI
jgi:phage tail-like protein